LGFNGYKVGMTHLIITDNRKTTLTRGEDISCPVTIIECPPLKVAGVRFYKRDLRALKVVSDIYAENLDKELSKKICIPKKKAKTIDEIKDFDELRLLIYDQPKLTSIGKKKPDLYEVGIGGTKDSQLKIAKETIGKEINIKHIFKDGQVVHVHGITKGKGTQGPVKRFGVSLRHHKSEKTRRGPGSLGAWCAQGHTMYRVAHAGRMGYYQRIEYNKWILKIGTNPKEINPKGGFIHYGFVNNPYVIIKGSIPGTVKRSVLLTFPIRQNKKFPVDAPQIQYISLESKQ
ncbi:MAG: 50S ribosomal protein L3, partial [Nanoarchaeota archaeon]